MWNYKIFIKIFEQTFQSVAGTNKLEKCSFKYFDEHSINFTCGIIVFELVPENISGTIIKYDMVG